jgi:hypothetical protein
VKLALFFILSLLSHQACALPKGWVLARHVDDVKIWMLNSNPEITGSERPQELKLEGIDFEKFEEKKKKLLGLFGVRDWRASSYRRDGGKLIVLGTYVDSKNRTILFKEIHSPSKQLLFTRPVLATKEESESHELLMKELER